DEGPAAAAGSGQLHDQPVGAGDLDVTRAGRRDGAEVLAVRRRGEDDPAPGVAAGLVVEGAVVTRRVDHVVPERVPADALDGVDIDGAGKVVEDVAARRAVRDHPAGAAEVRAGGVVDAQQVGGGRARGESARGKRVGRHQRAEGDGADDAARRSTRDG